MIWAGRPHSHSVPSRASQPVTSQLEFILSLLGSASAVAWAEVRSASGLPDSALVTHRFTLVLLVGLLVDQRSRGGSVRPGLAARVDRIGKGLTLARRAQRSAAPAGIDPFAPPSPSSLSPSLSHALPGLAPSRSHPTGRRAPLPSRTSALWWTTPHPLVRSACAAASAAAFCAAHFAHARG